MVRKYKQAKVDPNFEKIMRDVSIQRIKNGMENKQISVREVTRMTTNADCFKVLLNELCTKPRRKA